MSECCIECGGPVYRTRHAGVRVSKLRGDYCEPCAKQRHAEAVRRHRELVKARRRLRAEAIEQEMRRALPDLDERRSQLALARQEAAQWAARTRRLAKELADAQRDAIRTVDERARVAEAEGG